MSSHILMLTYDGFYLYLCVYERAICDVERLLESSGIIIIFYY